MLALVVVGGIGLMWPKEPPGSALRATTGKPADLGIKVWDATKPEPKQ